MDLFSGFRRKSTNITYYANQSIKVLNDFFSFGGGHVDMAKLIEAYGTNPIVFSIINLITGVCDGTEKQLLDGEKEIESGDTFDILKDLNERELYTNLLASGNAFLRYIKGIGMGAEFEVLNSKCVEILLTNSGTVKGYKYTIGDTQITIPEEEVLHIKFANIIHTDINRMHYGYSPLEAGMKIVTASSEIFNAEASIFKNRGVVGMLSSSSDLGMMPEDQKAIQENFQERAGGSDNFNKVLVTSANAKYVQMGMSPSDLQLIDNQLSKLRFLCALYGIDSKLLGDGANSTYNNVREAQKNAYTDTYLPLMKHVNEDLIKFLNKENGTNLTYKANLSKVEALKETQTLEDLILEKIAEREMSLEELLVIQNPVQATSLGVNDQGIESGGDVLDENDQAQAENILAQANLRGSVGGVQGILAIQASVQSGTTSSSAAIATLVEIYGFEDARARQILGL
jgi:HK97 family phage portal protein